MECGYSSASTVRTAWVILAALPAAAAEAVNTWLWFKVLQVDLILVFSDVLRPPHHHYRKLELETDTKLLDNLPLFYNYSGFKNIVYYTIPIQ